MVSFALPFGVAGPRQHLLDSTFTEAHPHRTDGPCGLGRWNLWIEKVGLVAQVSKQPHHPDGIEDTSAGWNAPGPENRQCLDSPNETERPRVNFTRGRLPI